MISRVEPGVVVEIVQAPLEGQGINLPDTDFEVASLTEKDRRDLGFLGHHADMIGYSFV